MKIRISLIAALFALVAACDSKTDANAHAAHDMGKDKMAVAAKAGAPNGKIDPPVKPDAVPDGYWYCDMGTVHFARADKGDGKCGLCGMDLKQKTAGAKAGEAHDHGEHGHDH